MIGSLVVLEFVKGCGAGRGRSRNLPSLNYQLHAWMRLLYLQKPQPLSGT